MENNKNNNVIYLTIVSIHYISMINNNDNLYK